MHLALIIVDLADHFQSTFVRDERNEDIGHLQSETPEPCSDMFGTSEVLCLTIRNGLVFYNSRKESDSVSAIFLRKRARISCVPYFLFEILPDNDRMCV